MLISATPGIRCEESGPCIVSVRQKTKERQFMVHSFVRAINLEDAIDERRLANPRLDNEL